MQDINDKINNMHMGKLIHMLSHEMKRNQPIDKVIKADLTIMQKHILKFILLETMHKDLYQKDIEKELTIGMTNLEYNMIHKPILFSKLNIDLMYVLSHKHISIQASDFIAGETRRIILSDLDKLTMLKKLEYLDVKLFLP